MDSAWAMRATDRRALRRLVSVPCQAVAERGFRLLGERVVDLSPEGMLVQSDATAELGEEVLVAFRAPRMRLWMDAQAQVARIVWGDRAGDRCRGIGLRFTRLAASDRAILVPGLAGFAPPAPGRRLRMDYASVVRAVASG